MGDSKKKGLRIHWETLLGAGMDLLYGKMQFPRNFLLFSTGMGYKLNFQALRVGLGTHEVFPTSQTRLKTGRCNPNHKRLGSILVSLSESKDFRIIFPHSNGYL